MNQLAHLVNASAGWRSHPQVTHDRLEWWTTRKYVFGIRIFFRIYFSSFERPSWALALHHHTVACRCSVSVDIFQVLYNARGAFYRWVAASTILYVRLNDKMLLFDVQKKKCWVNERSLFLFSVQCVSHILFHIPILPPLCRISFLSHLFQLEFDAIKMRCWPTRDNYFLDPKYYKWPGYRFQSDNNGMHRWVDVCFCVCAPCTGMISVWCLCANETRCGDRYHHRNGTANEWPDPLYSICFSLVMRFGNFRIENSRKR